MHCFFLIEEEEEWHQDSMSSFAISWAHSACSNLRVMCVLRNVHCWNFKFILPLMCQPVWLVGECGSRITLLWLLSLFWLTDCYDWRRCHFAVPAKHEYCCQNRWYNVVPIGHCCLYPLWVPEPCGHSSARIRRTEMDMKKLKHPNSLYSHNLGKK